MTNVTTLPNQGRPKPPAHLRAAGRDLWRSIREDYHIDDAAALALLATAAEALDRLRAAQEAVEADGELVADRYGQKKLNPALTLEKDARAGFLAALKMLNLDLEPLRDGPGRPPGR